MQLFHQFDKDDSGRLDPFEFRDSMLQIGIALADSDLRYVMEDIDTDADRFITAKEFPEKRAVKRVKRGVPPRTSPRGSPSPGRGRRVRFNAVFVLF